jgi:hypothetical protein
MQCKFYMLHGITATSRGATNLTILIQFYINFVIHTCIGSDVRRRVFTAIYLILNIL